jgi:hypothetical protein
VANAAHLVAPVLGCGRLFAFSTPRFEVLLLFGAVRVRLQRVHAHQVTGGGPLVNRPGPLESDFLALR